MMSSADIEADEVRERQRPHGMGHAEHEDLIDGLGRGDALHDGVDGFVDQRHQDTVGDEASGVVDLDRGLAELLRKRVDRVEGRLRGLQAANDLDQFHDRHGIEEVHPDDLVGALRHARRVLVIEMELVLVARMASGRQDAVEVAEELSLDLEAFGGGLDGESRRCEIFEVRGEGDAGAGLVGLLLRELFLGHFAGEVRVEWCRGRDTRAVLIDVVEQHVEAAAGADVRDAVAHGPGAEDCDRFRVMHKVSLDDFAV